MIFSEQEKTPASLFSFLFFVAIHRMNELRRSRAHPSMTCHRPFFATTLVILLLLVIGACSGSDASVGGESGTAAADTNRRCDASTPCPSGLVCGGVYGCFVPDCAKEGVGTGCPDGFYCVDPARDGDDPLTNKRRYCARVCKGDQDLACAAPNECSGDIDQAPGKLCLPK
jgi:hypothetical protein